MKKLLLALVLMFVVSASFGIGASVKGGYILGGGDAGKNYNGFGFGADVRFDVAMFTIAPELLYSTQKHKDFTALKWQNTAVNINALFILPVPVIKPYIGAGIGMNMLKYTATVSGVDYSASDTKYGYLAMVGVQLPFPILTPYVELRYTQAASDFSQTSILGGIALTF